MSQLLNTKCVFRVSVQFLSETFLILRRSERDMIKNVYRSSCRVPVLCQILLTLEFLDRFSENTKTPYQFVDSPSSESRVVTYGQTEGRTDRQT